MWRDLARQTLNGATTDGASDSDLRLAEGKLAAALPSALRELLSETDGVVGEYGLNLVWPLQRIVADNLAFRSNDEFRQLYMPFDPLLFFGDARNGDQLAYVILDGEVRMPDIFAWDHENDSRYWIAPDLRRFIEWWAEGRIAL